MQTPNNVQIGIQLGHWKVYTSARGRVKTWGSAQGIERSVEPINCQGVSVICWFTTLLFICFYLSFGAFIFDIEHLRVEVKDALWITNYEYVWVKIISGNLMTNFILQTSIGLEPTIRRGATIGSLQLCQKEVFLTRGDICERTSDIEVALAAWEVGHVEVKTVWVCETCHIEPVWIHTYLTRSEIESLWHLVLSTHIVIKVVIGINSTTIVIKTRPW
jgi:hypothetical protein